MRDNTYLERITPLTCMDCTLYRTDDAFWPQKHGPSIREGIDPLARHKNTECLIARPLMCKRGRISEQAALLAEGCRGEGASWLLTTGVIFGLPFYSLLCAAFDLPGLEVLTCASSICDFGVLGLSRSSEGDGQVRCHY